jgi:DNA polymerase-1
MLEMVRCNKVIAFDTETTGLKAHKDRVCGYVVANAEHSLYVPVRHEGGNYFSDPVPFERELARAFALRSRLGLLTVGFSLSFDLWMAGKENILIDAPLEDTQLNEVLLQDDRGRDYDLESRARDRGVTLKLGAALYERLNRFNPRPKTVSREDMQFFSRLRGDEPLAVEYAAGDGRTTYDLWAVQQPLLDRDELRRVHRLECALIPHLARMRRRGIRVDTDYAENAIDQIRDLKRQRRGIFPPDFKAKSATQVAEWLFEQGVARHQLPLTPTGRYSTRRSILERLEAGRKVIELRKIETAEGSFIRPLIDTHVNEGRVHCELIQSATDQAGTHTGRFSSRDPNLQAYPKRDAFIGKIVRPLLVPDEGFLFGEADVSQQEPRTYAHLANEEKLIEGYNAVPPVDVHATTGALLDIDRDYAKTLGLSLLNGLGERSLAERLNIPTPVARTLRHSFFALYPAIHDFTLTAPGVARSRGYTRTFLGRRAHFTRMNYHMAVSRVIQGSAADQMKTALLNGFRWCEENEGIEILMTIHDSVIFQARPGADIQGFKAALEDMSNFVQVLADGTEVPMRLPFPVDLKLGRNWGEASYGKKQ